MAREGYFLNARQKRKTFLKDLLLALDAMPEKRLIAEELEKDGAVCAIGSLGAARGLDVSLVDPEDTEAVANLFDIAEPLAREVVFENDECGDWRGESPEGRWIRMRNWVAGNILKEEQEVKEK